jgi:hypothetical protein
MTYFDASNIAIFRPPADGEEAKFTNTLTFGSSDKTKEKAIEELIFDSSNEYAIDHNHNAHLYDHSMNLFLKDSAGAHTSFRSDIQKEFKFLIEAHYKKHELNIDNNVENNVERQYSIIHLIVDPSDTGFKLSTDGNIHNVNETFGTSNDENAGYNNTKVELGKMLTRIEYHGSAIYTSGAELDNVAAKQKLY